MCFFQSPALFSFCLHPLSCVPADFSGRTFAKDCSFLVKNGRFTQKFVRGCSDFFLSKYLPVFARACKLHITRFGDGARGAAPGKSLSGDNISQRVAAQRTLAAMVSSALSFFGAVHKKGGLFCPKKTIFPPQNMDFERDAKKASWQPPFQYLALFKKSCCQVSRGADRRFCAIVRPPLKAPRKCPPEEQCRRPAKRKTRRQRFFAA